MPEIFADTAGWANFFICTEPCHHQAVALIRQWRSQGVRIPTTNYVLTELVVLFYSPLRVPRSMVIRYIDGIGSAPYVEIIHIDSATDADAWALLKAHPDKRVVLSGLLEFCDYAAAGHHRGVDNRSPF